jgi:hypothetical protein
METLEQKIDRLIFEAKEREKQEALKKALVEKIIKRKLIIEKLLK